jgi:UDP:flavonoid glycosyltransferase YjiC (YdhE family)
VRIVSCNPLEVRDPELPPPYSGLPVADPSGWEAFTAEYRRLHAGLHEEFGAWCVERGARPLPDLDFIGESPWLNLYGYPVEADYRRGRPLGPTWHDVEASVRATDAPWTPPEAWAADPGAKVVYLSLGSLGSADVGLMQRLIDALAATPHRVVVSLGPQHEELRLADGMVGAEFLPQTSVLPHVDLVITHGGNNTTVESLFFGKPTVVLPLFWDQHDNAQRMHELGLGVRLPTYAWEPAELTGAVDRLLGDEVLGERLARISRRLQGVRGTQRAADLIERVAREGGPVVRAA